MVFEGKLPKFSSFRSNRVLGMVSLSKGTTTGSIIDIKVLLQYAIKANASSIIVAHNHPSGNPEPSDADRKITDRIKRACELVEISLLDHLIILPAEEYLSFSDEGILGMWFSNNETFS